MQGIAHIGITTKIARAGLNYYPKDRKPYYYHAKHEMSGQKPRTKTQKHNLFPTDIDWSGLNYSSSAPPEAPKIIPGPSGTSQGPTRVPRRASQSPFGCLGGLLGLLRAAPWRSSGPSECAIGPSV